MRCLFCDSKIEKYNLLSLFIEEDLLCLECRNKLKIEKIYSNISDLKVESFYNYDGIFKQLLIQYKECYDEALYPIFLYKLKDYIKYKFFNYQILLVPSSINKLEKRGFNHLELIFKDVGLDIIDGLKMKENLIQEGKSLLDRKRMIDNYEYEGPKLNKVLIVDDVLTTGSSIMGVYKAIKPYANKIKALTLARKHFEKS
jgi:predicted amidophosphoribosyltransferase